MEIYVAQVVHFHSCLLGCTCCLLACRLGCHMLSGGKGITKVCAFSYNMGVSTCLQVDFLVVCAYY